MAIAATAVKIIGILIFALSLAALIGTNALAQVSEYDNIQPTITAAVEQQMPPMSEAQFSQVKSVLDLTCQQPGRVDVNFAELSASSPNITIQCTDVAALATPQDLTDFLSTAAFGQIYYEQTFCYMKCMTLSGANALLKQLVLVSIAGIILGLALVILAIRKPFPIMKAIGIEMAVTGAIAYFGINAVKGMLPDLSTSVAAPLIDGLMQTLANNFIIVLVIGIVLAVIGCAATRLSKKTKKAKPAKKRR